MHIMIIKLPGPDFLGLWISGRRRRLRPRFLGVQVWIFLWAFLSLIRLQKFPSSRTSYIQVWIIYGVHHQSLSCFKTREIYWPYDTV